LLSLSGRSALADLGSDLERVRESLSEAGRVESLRLRLLERGDIMPVVLPAWSLDDAAGACTSLVFLAPVPTQFVVHVHPWRSLPSMLASSAGAVEVTRCGESRVSLLGVAVEMRSPRAVVHTLVATSEETPAALSLTLPEREPGAVATAGDPGPAPTREPLDERLRRFEEASRNAGASAVEVAPLASPGSVRLALEPGCHRLLVSGNDGAPPYVLLLSQGDERAPERYASSENGDVTREICAARPQRLQLSLDTHGIDSERKSAVAHFPLPIGLPARLGPQLVERLLQALGGSAAPRALGTMVSATLGAQGRTPLPRTLLPQTCYLAAAVPVHGASQALSLGVRSGPTNAEASSSDTQPGARLGFCTGQSGHVELDVEARGLGLAWLFALFQLGPARPRAD
jgi:hypothetical protein